MSSDALALFNDILADNRSGSGTILNKTQEALLDFAGQRKSFSAESMFERMNTLVRHFPFFGLLRHFNDALINRFSSQNPDVISLRSFIVQYREEWKDAQSAASRNLMEKVAFPDRKVLIHSQSSAVTNLFNHIREAGVRCSVIQTYSSPAGEGVEQAEKLGAAGIPVTLIHEDATGKMMEEIDFAVFGTDLVLEQHFVNKTGTFPLCLMMRHFNKPVYVLSESRKHWNKMAGPPPETMIENPKPALELYNGHHPSIQVFNYYFESTPLSLVNEVILD